jgi:hypothetical protein
VQQAQAFGKKAGSVLKRSFVLRIKFSAGRQFSASKSASSPSAKTLSVILKRQTNKKVTTKK